MANYSKGRPAYAPWSEEEIEKLRALYPTTRWPDMLPHFPGRTRGAISQVARHVLKLPRPIAPRPKWTSSEDATVRANYPTASDEELRTLLPRHSFIGIQRRASELKILRPRFEARQHERMVHPIFKQLYQERMRQHIRRPALSKLTGYHHGMLLNWELGKSQPSFMEVMDWVQALNLELILAFKETPKADNVIKLPTKAQLMGGRAFTAEAVGDRERIKTLEAEVADLRHQIAQPAPGQAFEVPPELKLTARERTLFLKLMSAAEVTKEQLFYDVYSDVVGTDDEPDIKIIDVYVHKLRKKLDPHGVKIETMWGSGYFISAVDKAKLRKMGDGTLHNRARSVRGQP